MMPISRQDIEILLDSPDRRDYVVSAYADLTVKDVFRDLFENHFRNTGRAAALALSEAEARKALDANIDAIRGAVQGIDPSARGVAVFSSAARNMLHTVPLDFPVENRLVIDEEPFVLPLLERWYGEPTYLVVVIDSHDAQLFEAHAGVPEPVKHFERELIDDEVEFNRPRFISKKRFAAQRHERLRGMEQDRFLQEMADQIYQHWQGGRFSGLILLGQSQITGPFKKLLHKDLIAAIAEEAPQAMTTQADDVADDVDRALQRWHAERDQRALSELQQRWKENFHVANGPTDVLDALQQGRATRVFFGARKDLAGARCKECDYRFGAPVATCPYCNGTCRTVNATQEILRMALRHRVPVHLFRIDRGAPDPLGPAGGVSASLRAEANWAPDAATAQATQGH